MGSRGPLDRFRLDDKVVVVTGGSRGIGRAVAEGCAAVGATVVIASRKLDACEAAAAEITAATGQEAVGLACHVGRWEDCDSLVDAVYERFGHCDVLINNAGMSPLYPDLPSVSEELYDKVQAVNARGPFRLSALIGTRMAAAADAGGPVGSIINVSTGGTLRPTAHELPYAMAKAGLNALTLALAGTWAPRVRANLILPGAFDTDIAQAWSPEMRDAAAKMNPLRRMGVPDDMVGVCLFLASYASAYVNGAQLIVDGGAFRSL
jgi:NAD(P)-dependent dehydrogenase (short-subunit alcohol dehydrogenase family)